MENIQLIIRLVTIVKCLSTGEEVHQYNLDASSIAHVALKRKYCYFINSMIHIFYLLAYSISEIRRGIFDLIKCNNGS